MTETISDNGIPLAIIIYKDYSPYQGIEFFSLPHYSQQFGYIKRPKGYYIQRHIHNINERKVVNTQEVLMVRKGSILVTFYNKEKQFVCAKRLLEGDVIHLIEGGHGIFFCEDSEIVEVKQGPFCGEKDKVRF